MDKKQMMIDYLCHNDDYIRFILSKKHISTLEEMYNRRKNCEMAWKEIFGIVSESDE